MGFKPTTFRLQATALTMVLLSQWEQCITVNTFMYTPVDVCDQYIAGRIQKVLKRIP